MGGRRLWSADGCVTLANCSNCPTVREERPARTHWIQQVFKEGKASGGRKEGRKGWGDTTEAEERERERGGERRKKEKPINRELDGCEGTESRRTTALETSRVPSRGLVSAPNQLQGCSRSGSELCPSELIIMKKHSARVAPLSACNSPVLTLTKVEGRETVCSPNWSCRSFFLALNLEASLFIPDRCRGWGGFRLCHFSQRYSRILIQDADQL